jgi:hypothetical protein
MLRADGTKSRFLHSCQMQDAASQCPLTRENMQQSLIYPPIPSFNCAFICSEGVKGGEPLTGLLERYDLPSHDSQQRFYVEVKG